MKELTGGKVTLSQLLGQAQEKVRAEVLKLLKETLEGPLEALRDEIVGRERYERWWETSGAKILIFDV